VNGVSDYASQGSVVSELIKNDFQMDRSLGSVLNGTRLSIFGVAFLVRNGLEDAAVFGE
jgi:hypothetical protein